MCFKRGDALIDILQHMRVGKQFPDSLWLHLASRFAVDPSPGVEDPRFDEAKFCEGYGMSIYWASLGRMMCRRALLDAATLAQPLVLLQAADQCAELDKETAFRFLNRPNPYRTGHMHRIFPCHVRYASSFDCELGCRERHDPRHCRNHYGSRIPQCRSRRLLQGGEMFSPRFLPSGIWLSVGYTKDVPIGTT